MKQVKPSHSALEQFLFCERQFWFRRIAKIPEPPSHYLAIGNLYHECLATLLEEGGVDVAVTLAVNKRSPNWTSPTPDKKLIPEVVQNLTRVKEQIFPYIEPLSVEEWSRRHFLAKLDVVSAVTPVVEGGRIVGADRGPCIIDWKTVFSRKKRSSKDAAGSQQLALYAIEAECNDAAFVEIPRDVKWPLNVVVTHFTDAQLHAWKRYFEQQFAAMWSRGPDPAAYRLAKKGESLCSSDWCRYWDRCKAGKILVDGSIKV